MRIAQRIAADAVGQVLAGRNLSGVLDALFRTHSNITPQQRAVAQDLSYGTLRFYGRIESIIGQLLDKPLTHEGVHHLLLVALYQLLYDRASAHTIVNQAVEAAATFKKPWAKGLVNAVLRNYLRRAEEFAELDTQDEVARYSYPQWWIDKLKVQYPQAWQSILEAGNTHPPMSLRINLRKTTPQDYSASLSRLEIAHELIGHQAVILNKPVPVDQLPGFQDGVVSVQDYGAQFAADLLDVKPGMRVLDACCAPGGKTSHILELADVQMLGLDHDAERLQRVQGNLDRLQLSARLQVGDAANPEAWWDGVPFDRILADVPCTASGIVRRHVDIKWLRRELDVKAFAEQQGLILRSLWQLLAKGGKLLYATCSIFHEENQRQIERFLEQHKDASQLSLEHPQDGQLIPCAQHDGFFYALLQKD
ncbi:MAG: 16S rRNA (cytosine(967)-C(5))-methyltransferase RsmB [Betaproteobacteria bacterium HGW-Betaproteobacteria-8]|nr:MAG: 16S rRNA (cytosine(967)-C(5))-methyltransferase RsmB [Betaproteobacteria bacterium HGW-Betaproteobacteria-8]